MPFDTIHHFSSDSTLSPGLSPVQAQVVAALAQGRTVSAAALEAGLHRTTIHNWLRTLPAFAAAVEEARADYTEQLRDGLKELSALALNALRSLLEDPNTPPGVRLRAALAVLNRPRFPDAGWSLPETIYTPEQEGLLVDMAAVEANQRQMVAEEALYRAKRTHAASDPAPAAATVGPVPVPAAATPRNAPCPCGSGLKHKRCCGKDAPPLHNHLPRRSAGIETH